MARAIGKCAADESEPTLVAWLAGPRAHAVAAAIALGDVATAKSKLREETLAALLNLAAGSAAAPPMPEALYAVGRLGDATTMLRDTVERSERILPPNDPFTKAARESLANIVGNLSVAA